MLVTTWKIEPSASWSSRFEPQCGSSEPAATVTTAGVVQFVQSNVNVRVVGSKRGSVLVTIRLSSSKKSVIFTFVYSAGAIVGAIVYVSTIPYGGAPWSTVVLPSLSTMTMPAWSLSMTSA